MGYEGFRAKTWAIHLCGTRAYMVRDLLIDIQLRSCTEKFNIPLCYGDHRRKRERRLFELLREP